MTYIIIATGISGHTTATSKLKAKERNQPVYMYVCTTCSCAPAPLSKITPPDENEKSNRHLPFITHLPPPPSDIVAPPQKYGKGRAVYGRLQYTTGKNLFTKPLQPPPAHFLRKRTISRARFKPRALSNTPCLLLLSNSESLLSM